MCSVHIYMYMYYMPTLYVHVTYSVLKYFSNFWKLFLQFSKIPVVCFRPRHYLHEIYFRFKDNVCSCFRSRKILSQTQLLGLLLHQSNYLKRSKPRDKHCKHGQQWQQCTHYKPKQAPLAMLIKHCITISWELVLQDLTYTMYIHTP